MGIVTSMLYRRFRAGRYPLALVSMDNCSHNGERLKEAVLTVAREWIRRGYCEKEFEDYLCDEKKVAFPWTMIDKITPRPEPEVALRLTSLGIEDMDIVQTERKTFIAPFGNAEKAQYLVIEDSFPNGRPPLEDAGVYMTDRETVNKSERMKVCTCLNPIHTALCTYDCMLGYELFADGIKDPELSRLAHRIGYTEGLPVVADPGILSPKAFLDEVIHVRMPNPYLGDTSQRIAVDISQMVGIRFGETIKSYVKRYGSAERLTGIPLAIARAGPDDSGAAGGTGSGTGRRNPPRRRGKPGEHPEETPSDSLQCEYFRYQSLRSRHRRQNREDVCRGNCRKGSCEKDSEKIPRVTEVKEKTAASLVNFRGLPMPQTGTFSRQVGTFGLQTGADKTDDTGSNLLFRCR